MSRLYKNLISLGIIAINLTGCVVVVTAVTAVTALLVMAKVAVVAPAPVVVVRSYR